MRKSFYIPSLLVVLIGFTGTKRRCLRFDAEVFLIFLPCKSRPHLQTKDDF